MTIVIRNRGSERTHIRVTTGGVDLSRTWSDRANTLPSDVRSDFFLWET